jgi:tetratricopeptide (TPR) repeat protein/CHAT domain-containing protein
MILPRSWSPVVVRSALARSVGSLLVVVACSAANNAAEQAVAPYEAAAADTPEALQAERDKWQAEALRHYEEEKFAEAIRAAENMLAIERRWLGEDHPDVVGSLEFLAEVWAASENWDAAEARWSEAIAWREKNIGAAHWQTVDARLALENVRLLRSLDAAQRARLRDARAANNEVLRLYGEGRYADALALGAEALEINTAILGDRHRDIATLLNNLGVLHNSLGDVAAARRDHERALAIRQEILNDEHPVLAESFSNMGALLQAMGDFAAAKTFAEQALRIRKAAFGEDDPLVALSLNNLGAILAETGDYAVARLYYEQALAINRRVFGEEHSDTARSLNNLGSLLQETGDPVAARPYYEQALAINRKILGEEHPDTALSLNNLGFLLQAMGDYTAARPLYDQALAIRRKVFGEEHPDVAQSLNNLGHLLSETGDAVAARAYYEQALSINRKMLGEDHPAVADALNNLGTLLHQSGDYPAARPYFEQSLAIRRKALGEEHPDVALALNNLGGLFEATGDYAAARVHYERALATNREVFGEEHAATALSLNNLGALFSATGNSAAARRYYEQSLAINKKVLGENHPDTALSLNNLAYLLQSTGDHDAARPYYEQALAIRRKVFGEEHPSVAQSLSNLGVLLSESGDALAAQAHYEQALEIRRKVFGEDHPDVAQSLTNLGYLKQESGDYSGALPYYERALKIKEKNFGQRHVSYAQGLNNLAVLYAVMGDEGQAEPLFREGLEIVAELQEAVAVVQDEPSQLAYGRRVQHFLDCYLSVLLARDNGAETAYQAALRWKGATVVRQRAARLAAQSDELAPTFAELESVVRQWSTMMKATPRGDLQIWNDRLEGLSQRKEELSANLSRSSAAFRAGTQPIRLEDLQTSLGDGAVLVDYVEFWRLRQMRGQPGAIVQRSLAAFLIQPGKEVRVCDLGDTASINQLVDQWRAGYGQSAEAQAAGSDLRARIWEPLGLEIGGATTVLVSPDGALGRLPFAALPGESPETFLIEDFRIALVPVPRLIPALVGEKDDRSFEKEFLLLGGVDYDRRDATTHLEHSADDLLAVARSRGAARDTASGQRWDALPGAEAETTSIGALYREFGGLSDDALVNLRGPAATEEHFRTLASRCRRLHLATHGFFAVADKKSALASDFDARAGEDLRRDRFEQIPGYNPGLLSGLVLAGANNPPELPSDIADFANLSEDGILTAEEVAFLPLGGVELVVLSACDTGLGETAGGEGLLGIQRAFHVAGARSTVATLWKVSDSATQRLMTMFYRNVLQGKQSKLDALRNAQLELLRDLRDPEAGERLAMELSRGADAPADGATVAHGAPYIWAAFTLSGDWRKQ